MLSKLFKYEFKSTVRILGVIYLALLVCAVIFGIVGRSGVTQFGVIYEMADSADISTGSAHASRALQTAVAVFAIIYVMLVVAMFVMTIVLIISRFYRNLLQGEGYLMHTLPVPTWMLVASKTLSAFLWIVMNTVVVMLSAWLILLTSGVWNAEWASAFWNGIHQMFQQMNLYSVLTFILMIVEIVSFILMIYFCLSVGNVANRHKIAVAFLTFIGLCVAGVVISSLVHNSVLAAAFGNTASDVSGGVIFGGDEAARFFRSAEIRELILDLIYSAAFFFGTTWMLQKHLNLE